jgi:hypothetical protein
MGLAMHRFDSASKPMVMGVLCLLPLCAQAHWIIEMKDGEMKTNAINWADWLTTFKLILFAFQTEAGLEALHLTRSWESEGKFEASEYRASADRFVKTCHVLFDLGHAAKIGFGARMIKTLQTEDIGFCLRGETKMLEKPTNDMITKALGIMKEWALLAYKTIQAEVPHFEATASFVVLSLQGTYDEIMEKHAKNNKFSAIGVTPAGADDTEFMTNMQRFATFLEVDAVELREQIQEVRVLAKHLYALGSAPHEAWSQAWQQKNANAIKNWKQHDKYKALQRAVQFNAAWSLSTCGVEELISLMRHRFASHRASAHTQLINDEMDIACSATLGINDEELARTACKIFVNTWGIARQKYRGRCDAGSKRPRKCNSVADIRQQRDWEVEQIVAASKLKCRDVEAIVKKQVQDVRWSCSEVAKEADFQDNKHRDKLLAQASRPNPCLNANELIIVGQGNVDRHKFETTNKDKKYWNQKVRRMKKARQQSDNHLTDKKQCYLDHDAFTSEELSSVGPYWKMTYDSGLSIDRADVFVREALCRPGRLVEARACLIGGAIMDRQCFLSSGDHGFIMKYEPNLHMRKTWLVTAAVTLKHPALFDVVQAAFGHPICRSKLVVEDPTSPAICAAVDKLMKTAAKRVDQGYGTEFMFFITTDERDKYRKLRNVFHAKSLTEHIKKIDATSSRMLPARLRAKSAI